MLNRKAIILISCRSGIFIPRLDLFSNIRLEMNSEKVISKIQVCGK